MKSGNSILKNVGFLMFGNLSSRFISFFTAVLITRFLGPAKYGQFTFVITFVTLVSVFWEFGFSPLFVRDVSKDRKLYLEYSSNMIFLMMRFLRY